MAADLTDAGTVAFFAKGEHAMIHIHSSQGDFNLFGHFNKANDAYPISFIADVSKKGDTSARPLFEYRLTKADQSSGWHLSEAIMIDEKDKVINLAPPPTALK